MKQRCIFCKRDSEDSRSKEHILPESLGNTRHVLKPGVVCDACNNYFSLKLEGPILASGYFQTLRFRQALPNKKGRITPQKAILGKDIIVTLNRDAESKKMLVAVPSERWDEAANLKGGTIIFPVSGPKPDPNLMSRFLCKVGFEAFAQRILMTSEVKRTELVDDIQLDSIRSWARYGTGAKEWGFIERRIYDEDHAHLHLRESWQVVHEWDFLVTEHHEIYFIIAIFGVEYALNMGGPSVDGYQEWLNKNKQQSPLYTGKNAQ